MTTTPAAATSRTHRARTSRPDSDHVNEVSLRGDITAVAEQRVQAGGSEVTGFRVTVRPFGPDGKLGAAERIDCVAKAPGIRRRAAELALGDTVELTGALRHRYWRTAAGLGDRYEVEVTRCRRVRRA